MTVAATRLFVASMVLSGLVVVPVGASAQDPCALHRQGVGPNDRVDYVVPGPNPEGIDFDPRDCSYYTGSATNGTLFRGTLDRPSAEVWLPAGLPSGRDQAVGILLDVQRDLLFVAGGPSGKLFAYDLATRQEAGVFETGFGGFLNDVALTPTGDVYVTDSLRPVLHRITAAQVAAGGGTPQAIPLGPEVTYIPGFNANGVVSTVDGRYVLFCTTGPASSTG